jgi:cytidylate kinase
MGRPPVSGPPVPADVVVVTGPPGSGKSTVAALVVEAFDVAALVPGDDFFAFWTRGFVEPWLPASAHQNEVIVEAAGAAVGAYARGGCAVVYEGVLGPWLLAPFAAATGLGALHYAVLLPPVDTCLERVAGRSGHGFADPAATRQMHAAFTGAGIDARHVLADPALPPAAVAAELLRRLRAGSLWTPPGVRPAVRPDG